MDLNTFLAVDYFQLTALKKKTALGKGPLEYCAQEELTAS